MFYLTKQIRVRRSGLITFAIKLGSTLTGFAFIVLVTSNLPTTDFGLWQLISRVISYTIFVVNIPIFWSTRYRARGTILGKSAMVEAALFSLVLTSFYLVISFILAGAISGNYSTNLYFFLISAVQIPLYTFSGVLEGILWGAAPERASFGFGVFEIAKVVIGGLAVAVFHLSLTGAILAVTGAQAVQIAVALYLARGEFTDKVSFEIIRRMLRSGWLAILNLSGTFVATFDVLLVALVTGAIAENLIALYSAALVYASVVTYSNWIAFGLYAGILSGIDPRRSANQILELQYFFTAPMVVGEIILAYPLLHVFKQDYALGVPILTVLAIASAFNAFSLTFDSIITGSDRSDAATDATFASFLKSKLFLVAKINIITSAIYLVVVSSVSHYFALGGPVIFGMQQDLFIGVVWATAALGMWATNVLLKVQLVRKITYLSISSKNFVSLVLGTASFGAILYLLSRIIVIRGGAVLQALYILVMGSVGLLVYAAIVMSISSEMRKLTKQAIQSLLNR